MDSSSILGAEYQVFLSFRGPDTRQGFSDCLYHFLKDAGVRVFRDAEGIQPGEQIEGVLTAIKNSTVCIPIFSKGYASSKWCLRELALMVELETQNKIIPIFYDVTPDDVKLKTQLYRDALSEYKEDNEKDKEQWEKALKDVLGISGWESSGKKEENALMEVTKFKGWEVKKTGHGELCKLIVKEVLANLKVKNRTVTENLVGIDQQVAVMMNNLDIQACGVRYMGVYGVGGSGKTTLAQTIFNQLSKNFDAYSFLADVRESSKHGLEHLQDKLIHDLMPAFSRVISDIEDGIKVLRDTCRNKKVLIVLDDVDSEEQVRHLAGSSKWFKSGSRIIITTRDINVLQFMEGLLKIELWILQMEEMDFEHSLQLFSKHAFKMDHPPADFLDLSKEVVSAVGRLPLALRVMGSYLCGKHKEEWEENRSTLVRIPKKDIRKILLVSYKALDYRTKQIFLDMACLPLNKMNLDHMFLMWESCGFQPDIGLDDLFSQSIIMETTDESIKIHDHLRDLGREIICMESFFDFAEHSRLWDPKEAWNILKGKEGTAKIEILPPLSCDDPETKTCDLTSDHFRKLCKLRMLHLKGINLMGDFENLLTKLRWLSWEKCPADLRATNLCLNRLAILDLSNSDIEDDWPGWSEIKVGGSLRILDLSRCYYITSVPNITKYTNLQKLTLDYSEISSLPDSIGCLSKLETLSLKSSGIEKLPDSFGNLQSLSFLDISKTGLLELPDSIGDLRELKTLNMTECRVTTLPRTIGNMKKLERLFAELSSLQGEIPAEFGKLSSLTTLVLSFTEVCMLPSSISQLSSLKSLLLTRCDKLEELPNLPPNLTVLKYESLSIKRVPDLSNLTNLTELVMIDNSYNPILNTAVSPRDNMIKALEDPTKRTRLDEQSDAWIPDGRKCIVFCVSNISTLPENLFGCVPNLETLWLGFRGSIRSPDLPSSLKTLVLDIRQEDTKLPCLSNLKNLSYLTFIGCFNRQDELKSVGLRELERLETLVLMSEPSGRTLADLEIPASLRALELSGFAQLPRLPDLSHLGSLQLLKIEKLKALSELPDLRGLVSLRVLLIYKCKLLKSLGPPRMPLCLSSLHIYSCKRLRMLPDLSGLKNLRVLKIKKCMELVAIPGLRALESLEELSITLCNSLKCLWPRVGSSRRSMKKFRLKNLKWLKISQCKSLSEISGLGELELLRTLNLMYLYSLNDMGTCLPASLEELQVVGCEKLKQVPNISNLKKLRELNIYYCFLVREVPGLEELKVDDLFLKLNDCDAETDMDNTINEIPTPLQQIPEMDVNLDQTCGQPMDENINRHPLQKIPGQSPSLQ